MGKSSVSMPSPSPQIASSATTAGNTGADWLNFANGAYGQTQTAQTGINTTANTANTADQNVATTQNNAANTALSQYQNTFAPLLNTYAQQAESYDTPAMENEQAAAAGATVQQAAQQQNNALQQQLTAQGVNPNSGQFQGIESANALNTAVATAGAENTARQQTQATGLNLESNALGLGNSLTAQSEAETGLGLNASTSGLNALTGANNELINDTSIMNAGYGGAETGATNEGSLLENEYNSEASVAESQEALQAQEEESLFGGLGSVAGLGTLGLLMSSKEFKIKKRKSAGNLKAVRSMPVERWRYKPGIGDGGAHEHTGPYAEDFHKATGGKHAGRGKAIPMQDALGITMGAVQELAHEVDKVKRSVGLGMPKPKGHAPSPKPHRPHPVKAIGIKPPHLHVAKPHEIHAHSPAPKRRFSIRRHEEAA